MFYNLAKCRLRRILKKWESGADLTNRDRETFYQIRGEQYRIIAEKNYVKADNCKRFQENFTGGFDFNEKYSKFYSEFKVNLKKAGKSFSLRDYWRRQ